MLATCSGLSVLLLVCDVVMSCKLWTGTCQVRLLRCDIPDESSVFSMSKQMDHFICLHTCLADTLPHGMT